MPLDRSSLVGQHPHADRGLDLYEIDRLAIGALLQVEKLPHGIWEPVAGRGAIARILRDHGHAVIASDIEDRGGLHFVADFLSTTTMPVGTECIVSNPPFKIIEGFIAHALELRPRVVMLAQLSFFEAGTSRARRHQLCRRILDVTSPARVYAFRDRRVRKRMFRRLWIIRINAACRARGLRYSQLIHGLQKGQSELNRQTLSEIAIHDPAGFDKIAEFAKEHL